jgi:hypothetical protein
MIWGSDCHVTISYRLSFRSDYRRWWSLSVNRNIRQFDYNYSLFVDLLLFLLYFNIFFYVVVLHFKRLVWVQIPSREEQNLTALKSNSNTVWFNFQTYIIFSINLVSFKVTLRSSGTDILYGCYLLLDVCIIYFISCDCIMNSSLSYTIY